MLVKNYIGSGSGFFFRVGFDFYLTSYPDPDPVCSRRSAPDPGETHVDPKPEFSSTFLPEIEKLQREKNYLYESSVCGFNHVLHFSTILQLAQPLGAPAMFPGSSGYMYTSIKAASRSVGRRTLYCGFRYSNFCLRN